MRKKEAKSRVATTITTEETGQERDQRFVIVPYLVKLEADKDSTV